MATRNYVTKLYMKQSLPFPLQAIRRYVDLQSGMPVLRRKCTNGNVHLLSQTAKMSQAVHIKHQPRQKQKHFHPIFMTRVCFIITGQLRYHFLLQQKFQSAHTTADCTAILCQHNCSTAMTNSASAESKAASSPLSLGSRHQCRGGEPPSSIQRDRCFPQQTCHRLKMSSHAASHQAVTQVTCMVHCSPRVTRKNKPCKSSRIPRKDWRSDCWYMRENSG